MRGAPSSAQHPLAKLSSEQLSDLRRRHAEGERAAALAVEFGVSRASAFRAVAGTSYREEVPDAPRRMPSLVGVQESNRRRSEAARIARESRTSAPTPHLAAARAEFLADRPRLAVETLEQRLRRCLQGAVCFREGPDWVVCRLSALARHELARRPSEREAIDVAVSLWGGR